MRLAEFLALVLQTQGQTLARLAAFFGEERCLELLENVEDPGPAFSEQILGPALWAAPSGSLSESSAYAELEASVTELQIPAFLGFYVWTYPWYRHFVESGLPLNAVLRSDGAVDNRIETLLRETFHAQDAWFRSLRIPPAVAAAAEKATQYPWLRFRADLMRRLGRKPLTLA